MSDRPANPMNMLEALINNQLYVAASKEIDEILPPDMDERLITPYAVRMVMIACWLRGVAYHREQRS